MKADTAVFLKLEAILDLDHFIHNSQIHEQHDGANRMFLACKK